MSELENYKKFLEAYAKDNPDEKLDFEREVKRKIEDVSGLLSEEIAYQLIAVKYGYKVSEDLIEDMAEETKSKSKPIPISVTDALDENRCSSQGKPIYLNVRGILKKVYGPKVVELEGGKTNYTSEVYLGDLNNNKEIKITCWSDMALMIPHIPIGADVMITSVLTKHSISQKDGKDYGIQGSTQKYSTVMLSSEEDLKTRNVGNNNGPATFTYEAEHKGGLDI
jgi:hypothetical protein